MADRPAHDGMQLHTDVIASQDDSGTRSEGGSGPQWRQAGIRERLLQLGPYLRKRALIGALVTLLVLLPFYLQLTLRAQEWLLGEARVEVSTKLDSHGNALASALYRRLALLQSLRAYVRSDLDAVSRALDPESSASLDSWASGLSVGTTGVTYFSIAPSGRLRYVYPLATNEDLLDTDLLRDACPDLRANALRAIATHETAVGWLREGCRDSQRLCAHLAVLDEQDLWGLVGMVLDLSPILYEAGIQAQPSDLDLALRDHTGMVLVGPSAVFSSQPAIHRIELPDGYWELAGVPAGGWSASIRGTLAAFQAAGLAIMALVVVLVGVIVTRQDYLAQMVRDRTTELESVNHELQVELAERQRIETALRDSEELYKTLVETSPDAVVMTDVQGQILSVSRRMVEWHGYAEPDALVGLNTMDLVTPADRTRAREHLQATLRSDEPSAAEYTLMRRDGTSFVGEIRSSPINDAEGRPRAIVSTIRDITQRRRDEEALQELAANLEDRVRQRTFEVQVLYELSQQIGFELRDDELLGLTLQHAQRVVPYDAAAVLLLLGDDYTIYIRSARELSTHSERQLVNCLIANYGYVSGRALDADRARVTYLHQAPMDADKATVPVLGSVFQVPLVFSRRLRPNEATLGAMEQGPASQIPLGRAEKREVVGLLVVAAEEIGAFSEDQMRLVYTMANQTASALQRMRALLAAQQERLESLVENLPEGVLLLDGDFRPLVVNPAARHYLVALGSVVQDGVLSQLGGKALGTILRWADGHQPYELVTEGPPRRTYEVLARPLLDDDQDGSEHRLIRSWVLVLRDVTEERSVQARMQQQARLAAVGQLAAGIAHDFNNLLTLILGYAELAATDPDLPDAFREDMDIIARQGRRAADLVRQILDFSRKSISRQQTLDLAPFMRETVKLLQRTLPEPVAIVLEASRDEDYTVRADITQMQQAITNLAINARDAMPEGGTLSFGLSRFYLGADEEPPVPWMPPGHWVRLTVTDTGVGISDQVMPHVFEPFFTTKGPTEGTGLGLSQVYGIVRQHNGFIGVESEPGAGATVTMYFPAQVSPQLDTTAPERRRDELPRGSDDTTILVVEDEDAVRQVSARTLERLGYHVLSSRDGVEALGLYDRYAGSIDLVLMDLVMPKMGGRELLLALRERDPNVKVIVMSGYPLDVEVEDILVGEHIAWLPKPLRLGDLAARVRAMLDRNGSGALHMDLGYRFALARPRRLAIPAPSPTRSFGAPYAECYNPFLTLVFKICPGDCTSASPAEGL